MDEILRLKHIRVTKAEKTILNIPDFSIKRGERVAIIGPNGAGKTTLMKLLAFLEEPDKGKRLFCGKEYKNKSKIRREMSAVFQNPLLLNMSVFDNVALGLRFRNYKPSYVKDTVGYWLKKLNIYHLRKQYARDLSGGEAQRVSIARALCLNPKILFLDEPFSYLDAPTKEDLLAEIKSIITEKNITTVFITHDFTEIPYLATKACVMFQGRIHQRGTPQTILYKPSSVKIAKFLGIHNIFEGKVIEEKGEKVKIKTKNKVITATGRQKVNTNVKICVRSEYVKLNESRDSENVFKGRVCDIFYKGNYNRVDVDIGFKIKATTTKNFDTGEEVAVTVPENRIHLIT